MTHYLILRLVEQFVFNRVVEDSRIPSTRLKSRDTGYPFRQAGDYKPKQEKKGGDKLC